MTPHTDDDYRLLFPPRRRRKGLPPLSLTPATPTTLYLDDARVVVDVVGGGLRRFALTAGGALYPYAGDGGAYV